MSRIKSNKNFIIPIIIFAILIFLAFLWFLLDSPLPSLSVNRVTGRDVEIFFPTDGSNPYLAVPITIEIKNVTAMVQPVDRVSIKIDDIWINSWNEVYETNGNRVLLPKDIEPDASLRFILIIPIPIEPRIAQSIRDAYELPLNISTATLGTIDDYKIKTSQVKYSWKTLYSLSQRHVKIYVTFMTAAAFADDLNVSIETIVLP